MLVVRKSIPELIEFFNSTLGSDMTYLCKCILTDYNGWTMSTFQNYMSILDTVDMPIQFWHGAFNEAALVASGVRQ